MTNLMAFLLMGAMDGQKSTRNIRNTRNSKKPIVTFHSFGWVRELMSAGATVIATENHRVSAGGMIGHSSCWGCCLFRWLFCGRQIGLLHSCSCSNHEVFSQCWHGKNVIWLMSYGIEIDQIQRRLPIFPWIDNFFWCFMLTSHFQVGLQSSSPSFLQLQLAFPFELHGNCMHTQMDHSMPRINALKNVTGWSVGCQSLQCGMQTHFEGLKECKIFFWHDLYPQWRTETIQFHCNAECHCLRQGHEFATCFADTCDIFSVLFSRLPKLRIARNGKAVVPTSKMHMNVTLCI